VTERIALLERLPATRFNGVSRATALAILTATAFAIVVLVGVALMRPPSTLPSAGQGPGDLATYQRIVEAMRSGSDYYTAAHDALRAGGYGTLSIFNWRLPTLAWLQSLFAPQVWTGIAGALALAAIGLMTAAIARRDGMTTATMVAVLLTMSFGTFAVPAGGQFTETFAGVLITLSAAAFGLRYRLWGVGFAIAALFVRELAAIYVVICLVLAWRIGDRREWVAWAVGIVMFALFFAWHAASVYARIGPEDVGYADGWLQFGGLRFVLEAAGFNGFLTGQPLFVPAVILPLSLLGLSGWADNAVGTRVRWTVIAYVLTFMVVGKPFNGYWGALMTPLMMIGVAIVPACGRDLWRAVRRPSTPATR
jgi:hypothetical protein